MITAGHTLYRFFEPFLDALHHKKGQDKVMRCEGRFSDHVSNRGGGSKSSRPIDRKSHVYCIISVFIRPGSDLRPQDHYLSFEHAAY